MDEDIRKYLSEDPEIFYADEWKGWADFLGIKMNPKYYDYKVAKELCVGNKINTGSQYRAFRKIENKKGGKLLPANPNTFYPDWKSWSDFLGKKSNFPRLVWSI